MSGQKISTKAWKVCRLTLFCMVVMFGVAAMNKARGGEGLVAEYTITEGLPRHVKFETMPSPADEAQRTVAWYFKYCGVGQFDLCGRLFPEDQHDALNFKQSQEDYKEGRYIKEYIVHNFTSLEQTDYAEFKELYDGKAKAYGYEEYKVVRVNFSQKWSEGALEMIPQWGDGEYTRDFAVGKEPGFKVKWKIFELGMM